MLTMRHFQAQAVNLKFYSSGDSCCFSFSLGAIKNIIEEEIPGIYVKSVKIGNNVIEVITFLIKN